MGVQWETPLPVTEFYFLKSMINKVRSISYNFIWGKQREVAWQKMALPRNEGGMGIKDYEELQIAAIIERTGRAWTKDGI